MSCFFENLDEGFGRTPYKMSYYKNKQINNYNKQKTAVQLGTRDNGKIQEGKLITS